MQRRHLIGLSLAFISSKAFCDMPQYWNAKADVVVIGGGAAGLSAAVSAAEHGASVMLFEKMTHLGGDTLIAGGYFNAVDPKRQKPMQIEDSEALFAAHILKSGAGYNTPDMAEAFAHESTVTLTWLEGLGMQFLPHVEQIFGGGFSRSHKPILARGISYIKTLSSAALKHGVKIKTASPVVRFVWDERRERVAGVVIIRHNRPLFIRAQKGVIAAFGGFGASREMRQRFAPSTAQLSTDSHPGATGELLKEAQSVGASLINMQFVECVPGSDSAFNYPIRLDYVPSRMIIVNSQGKRFTDETAGRRAIAEAVLKEMDKGPCYTIASTSALEAFDPISLKNLYRGRFAGQAWKAQTPEALALIMGLPAATLSWEIRRAAEERSLKKPPFWGVKLFLRVHNTLGGIRIDTEARAQDENGRPIAGLFAAGEAVGSVHGAERIGGNGISSACTFGRLAGKNAALNFSV